MGPSVPIMVLSATATSMMKNLISDVLGLKQPVEIEGSIDRESIFLSYLPESDLFAADVLNQIELNLNNGGITFVFSKTIQEASHNFRLLKKKFGDVTDLFHSRNSDSKKDSVIRKLKNLTCKILCCTSAMGMVFFFCLLLILILIPFEQN